MSVVAHSSDSAATARNLLIILGHSNGFQYTVTYPYVTVVIGPNSSPIWLFKLFYKLWGLLLLLFIYIVSREVIKFRSFL